VSSLAEIQSAIQQLGPHEMAELAVWFEEYQEMISASAEILSLYDREEDARPLG
jgi:hypothetical protein